MDPPVQATHTAEGYREQYSDDKQMSSSPDTTSRQ